MAENRLTPGAKVTIDRDGLQALVDALAARGYRVIGPTVRDGAIVYDNIATIAELPVGWRDHQEPGRYRLERRDDEALFGFAVGPQAWKRFLHPPVETLWTARKSEDGLTLETQESAAKFAFIGVRACEIHAIAIQDRVFCEGPFVDKGYAMRRRDAFVVAVNCGEPGGTCFCVSMQTGPKAQSGFDLALTELVDDNGHHFLAEIGSEAGADVLGHVSYRPASNAEIAAADAVVTRAAGRMGRTLETDGLKELLQSNLDHPRWDAVAERCLTCANCTMVCPPASARPSRTTAISPAHPLSACANGTRASLWTSPICTAAACVNRAGRVIANG